nr:PREDICTED: uncharacterized protein LOC109044198 [Bemisia tabaci]
METKMKSVLSFMVLCLLSQVQAAQEEARSIKPGRYPRMERACYRKMPTPELNECLRSNFQGLVPRMRSGIPGIYTGSVDPLYWPKFAHYFGGALIQGSLSVHDLSVWGFSNTKIQAVRANVKNPQKMLVEVDWLVPKMDFFGHFKLNARMGTDFHGHGPFWLNLTDVGGTWTVTGAREKGEPTMEIVSFRGAPKIGGFKLRAKGAAFGNDALNDLVIATINGGWRLFHQIANPAVDREWGGWCRDKLNRVFLTNPYDELFPEKPIR